jgi:hypothetical protein
MIHSLKLMAAKMKLSKHVTAAERDDIEVVLDANSLCSLTTIDRSSSSSFDGSSVETLPPPPPPPLFDIDSEEMPPPPPPPSEQRVPPPPPSKSERKEEEKQQQHQQQQKDPEGSALTCMCGKCSSLMTWTTDTPKKRGVHYHNKCFCCDECKEEIPPSEANEIVSVFLFGKLVFFFHVACLRCSVCHVGLSNSPFKCISAPIVASNKQSEKQKQQSKLQVCCVHHDIKSTPETCPSAREEEPKFTKKTTSKAVPKNYNCVSCKQRVDTNRVIFGDDQLLFHHTCFQCWRCHKSLLGTKPSEMLHVGHNQIQCIEDCGST